MAMTIDKLTGRQVTPDELSRFAEANGYRDDTGTNWNFVNAAAKNYGLTSSMRENPSAEFINSQLNAGKPVVLSGTRTGGDVGSSPYTSEGHYVVAVGKDKNGNVLINDPRGKSYSKAYSMDVITQQTGAAWGFSKGGGLGPIVSKLSKSKKKRGGRGVSGDWLSIVKSVKASIAAQKPGYNQKQWISITYNGKTLKVRTDCSGFVGACLKFYGVIGDNDNYSSYTFAKRTDKNLSAAGFTSMAWNGWDSLVEGDIIAKNGHVEIFARNENGKHYVYNCGSNNSVNSAEATVTGHNSGYSTVWRPANAGTGASVSISGTNGTEYSSDGSSTGSVLDELYAPITKIMNQITGNVTNATGSSTTDTTSTSIGTVSAENLTGSDTAEKVWNFFTQNGYSKAATAGIMGNLYQESRMNPESIQNNGSGPAAGIAQWENYRTRSGRWKNLDDYASSKGKSWKDLGSQLEFMHKELGSKNLSVFWKKGSALKNAGADPTSYEEWKQSNNVEMATRQFEGAFERAGKPVMENRIKYANAYHTQYASTNTGGSGGGFGEGDSNIGSYSSDTLEKTSGLGTVSKINVEQRRIDTKSDVDAIMKQVLSYLKSISDNTGATSDGIKTLNRKGFNTQTSSKGGKGEQDGSTPVILPVQGNSKPEKAYDSDYDLAKQISLGRI